MQCQVSSEIVTCNVTIASPRGQYDLCTALYCTVLFCTLLYNTINVSITRDKMVAAAEREKQLMLARPDILHPIDEKMLELAGGGGGL